MESLFKKMGQMIEDGIKIHDKEFIHVFKELKPAGLFYGKKTRVLEQIEILQLQLEDKKLVDSEFHVLVDYTIDLINDYIFDSYELLLKKMQGDCLHMLICLVRDKIDAISFVTNKAVEVYVSQHHCDDE